MEIDENNHNDNEPSLAEQWANLETAAQAVDKNLGINQEGQTDIDTVDEEEIESAALMEMAVGVTASIFAPNWQLQPEECEQLGAAYGALFDKYMPNNGFGKYKEEIAAVMVTAMILKSRDGVAMKIEEKPKKTDGPDKPETKQQVIHGDNSGILRPKAVSA